jgi:DNA-binding XRE family transcriptional regulator
MADTKITIMTPRTDYSAYMIRSFSEDGINHIENMPKLSEAIGLWVNLADDLRQRHETELIENHVLTLTPLTADECRLGIQPMLESSSSRCSSDLPCLRILEGSIVDDTEVRSRPSGSFAVKRLSRPMSAGQMKRWRQDHGYTQEKAADMFRLSLKTIQQLEQRDPFDAALWGPISVICQMLDNRLEENASGTKGWLTGETTP